MKTLAALTTGVLVIAAVVPRSQDGVDLPDPDSFYAATIENIAASSRVQNEYAYKERRTELHTNPFGRLGTGEVLLYEVIPLAEGAGHTRQLLERGGKVVEDAEVERMEQRPREEPRRRSSVEDVSSVLDFTLARREIFEGRPAIVVAFTPKRNAEATTRQGRLARAFSGEIWIDEEAQQVRHVEATSVETISYGWGVLARLGKGAVATLEREPIGGGVWMLTSVRLTGSGRALFWLRRLTVDYHIEWFDYRRLGDTPG
jgi:hypothetical protein